MLWVNLIMDTLASLALATEPRIYLNIYIFQQMMDYCKEILMEEKNI